MGDLVATLSEALAWTLLNSLWQGALIAALLWISLRLLGAGSAARYPVADSALLLLVALPVFTFTGQLATPDPVGAQAPMAIPALPPEHVGAGPGEEPATAAAALLAPQDSVTAGVRWAPLLVAAWLLGSLLLSLRLLGGFVLVHRLRTTGLTVPGRQHTELLDRLAARLQLSGRVALRLSRRTAVPIVTGVVKPLVLLPVSVASGLATRDIELLLAHELAHVKRNDLLMTTVQRMAETLMYYHPATWWISGIITDEREVACDLLAVAVTGAERREYATALLRVAEQQRVPALSAGATGGSLLRRVQRLLGRSGPADRFTPLLVSGLLTVAAGWFLASQAQVVPEDAGYRTVWVTAHREVQFARDYGAITHLPEGSFVLLEERRGNELLRRALLTAPGATAEQAAALAGGAFSSSVDQPAARIWFDTGTLGAAAVDADWVADVLQRNVLDPLQETIRHELPQLTDGFTAVRTSGPTLFTSFVFDQYRSGVPLLYGQRQADNNEVAFEGQVPQVRLTTHLLAHGLVDGDAALQFLFDVLRHHVRPAPPLLKDILLLVPFLPTDAHRLELLEALALKVDNVPASLQPLFGTAISSFDAATWAEQAAQVFSEDYVGLMNAAHLPLSFAVGTLNTAGGTRTGWYAEVVPAGYVERRLSFQLEDPAGQVLHQHLARDEVGQLRPHHLFGTVDDLPAGRYRLALSWLGRTVEAHVEVDRAELLPLVSGVRFEEDLVLAWDAVPGAQRYRVDVRTPTGTRVYWLTEPTDTPVLTLEGLLSGAHSIENVWAYSQPAGCDGCQLNASVAKIDLVFDVP